MKLSVQSQSGITISTSSIDNYLKDLHYTFKNIHVDPERLNTPNIIYDLNFYVKVFDALLDNFSYNQFFFVVVAKVRLIYFFKV